MSYRGFKHLLGETSLERKCRFIFSGGILLLVTISFWLYGKKTESLVIGQTTQTARMQVENTLINLHCKALGGSNLTRVFDVLSGDFSALEEAPLFEASIIDPYPKKPVNFSATSKEGKLDPFEQAALKRFLQSAASEENFRKPGVPRPKAFTFSDGTDMWVDRFVKDKNVYQYMQAVLFKPSCQMPCHTGRDENGVQIDNHLMRRNATGKFDLVKSGDLACVVVVNLPMKPINQAIIQNRAILISAALATAVFAMIASYVIVRYVIVKPVKHLRDVSDAIAAGRLSIRAQIHTGDDFEELSHAFNRMLHNLVAMQQEIREVNGDLDRKVDELAQANLALFEMNRLKSDFLATISHELRTPLNSIIGFSEVLSESDQLNERQRRYATNIQTSGKMLLVMINDILDHAKIESGKMEVRTEDFSLRDICEGVINVARPIAERRNINLEFKIDDAIPLMRQDPGKLRQVLYNLTSNAIKFTPEGGRVTLSARADGRIAVIEVDDTGIGIALEDQEKVFEKFRQAGVSRAEEGILTREHQGTGLGLSIVRELSKLLGGDVVLKSQPGQGSTFTVRVPLQLPGNRKFEVNLSDERIDLSKARRIEPRQSIAALDSSTLGPNSGTGSPPLANNDRFLPAPHRTIGEPIRGFGRDR